MTDTAAQSDANLSEAPDDSPVQLLHRVLQVALDIYSLEAATDTTAPAITQRQFAVLAALDPHDGISQTDLAAATHIDRSTLAELVTRMVQRRMLRREPCPTDARINLIRLDVAGHDALNRMRPHVRAADDKVLALLSPDERGYFLRLLRQMAQGSPGPQAAADPLPSKPQKSDPDDLSLPMPPLSQGATGKDDDAPPDSFKPPKPIWKN